MEIPYFESYAQRDGNHHLHALWAFDRAQHDQWVDQPRYCGLCKQVRPFHSTAGEGTTPDFREQVICGGCGLNARVRAALGLLIDSAKLDERACIYATEQITSTYVWMQNNLPGALAGSEFEPSEDKRRELSKVLASLGGTGDVQFNDITASRFEDARFDGIISLDVLEHVPDYATAFAEFARTLKPGGVLVATFPFADTEKTIVRAELDSNGEVRHLLEPEYHGDPISGGVLCWYHFGWDVLNVCKKQGFSRAGLAMPWSPVESMQFGLWTLIAHK